MNPLRLAERFVVAIELLAESKRRETAAHGRFLDAQLALNERSVVASEETARQTAAIAGRVASVDDVEAVRLAGERTRCSMADANDAIDDLRAKVDEVVNALEARTR